MSERTEKTALLFDARGGVAVALPKPKSANTAFAWAVLWFCFGAVAACLAFAFVKTKPAATFSGGYIFTGPSTAPTVAPTDLPRPVDDPPPTMVTDKAILTTLAEAVVAWETALHRNITPPFLFQGDAFRQCHNPNAMACCFGFGNMIFVTPETIRLQNPQLRTVLMHEIGHLLGVPHIEGDALMNADYLGVVLEKPTPFAIALARAAERL